MKPLALLLAALAGPAFAGGHADALKGDWASLSCEVRPQPGPDGKIGEWRLTRAITIGEGAISAEFTTYADAACAAPLQRLDFAGKMALGGDSAVAQGAVEADLTIDQYVRFTPLAQGFADFLNSAEKGTCGAEAWAVGKTQDIHVTGCSVIGLPPNAPTVEYEVLMAKDDLLYFGARPVDGTFLSTPDTRPTALQVPLARVK